MQTVNGTTIATADVTMTPATITDATGYPGLWCPYTDSDLYMDATHRCRQRQSGAYNWEAWIKDTRDVELYRIVYMPDNKWWLAQNVKLANYGGSTVGSAISGCTKDECGRAYPHAQVYAQYAGGSYGSTGNVQGICPPGWLLPITADIALFIGSIGTEDIVSARLRALNSNCSPILDYYGWASKIKVCNYRVSNTCESTYANDSSRDDGLLIDWTSHGGCGHARTTSHYTIDDAVVRCFRQL
jgi:uncharacterized protein (TIGR02145 family)